MRKACNGNTGRFGRDNENQTSSDSDIPLVKGGRQDG